MARGAYPFRQRDVKRAIKAAQNAGCDIVRVEIAKDKITLVTSKAPAPVIGDDLDRELAEFEARHAG